MSEPLVLGKMYVSPDLPCPQHFLRATKHDGQRWVEVPISEITCDGIVTVDLVVLDFGTWRNKDVTSSYRLGMGSRLPNYQPYAGSRKYKNGADRQRAYRVRKKASSKPDLEALASQPVTKSDLARWMRWLEAGGYSDTQRLRRFTHGLLDNLKQHRKAIKVAGLTIT